MPHPTLNRRSLLIVVALFGVASLPAGAAAQEKHEIIEMAMGSPDAPVTLIEYASLTCPHCADFHTTVLPEIRKAFIDTGKVRLIYREVYFDRPGLWAAMIARCAGPDRYFGVIDLMYRTRDVWTANEDGPAIAAALYGNGRQAGLTDAEMDACLQDAEFAKALVAEYQKNATADAITSTPSFLINGEKADNMQWPEFEAKLNEALGS